MKSVWLNILLAFPCFYTGKPSPLNVTIEEGARPAMLEEGQRNVSLTCVMNSGITALVNNHIKWVHFPMVTPGAPGVPLSTDQTLVDDFHSDFSVRLIIGNDCIYVTLAFKRVKAAHDGIYVCRISNRQSGAVLAKAEIDLVVVNDVETVSLDFEEATPLTEGDYNATCHASGFNPDATVSMYLGDRKLASTPARRQLDVSASRAAGGRRYSSSTSLTSPLTLTLQQSGQSLRCEAQAAFHNSSVLTVDSQLDVVARKSQDNTDSGEKPKISGAPRPAALDIILVASLLLTT